MGAYAVGGFLLGAAWSVWARYVYTSTSPVGPIIGLVALMGTSRWAGEFLAKVDAVKQTTVK